MLQGYLRVLVPAVLLAVALSWTCNPTLGQTIPFKISGDGVVLDDLPPAPGGAAGHDSSGEATHLGRYQGIGIVQIETIDFSTLSGTFSSQIPYVFTAANGDQIAFQYGRTDAGSGASPPAAQPGAVVFEIQPNGQLVAVWDAEFNPVPALCTGRFANVVSGSFRMIAVTDPFDFGPLPAGLPYRWSGEGQIEFGR